MRAYWGRALIVALAVAGMPRAGQADLSDSLKAARLDLAVPQAPAFELLDVNPDAILRPGTFRELAVGLGSGDLRQASVEFAPVPLFAGHQSLTEYQRSRLWNTWRVSLATQTPEGGAVSMSAGLRVSIIDRSDPRMDRAFLHQLYGAADRVRDAMLEANKRLRGNPALFEAKKQGEKDEIQSQINAAVAAVATAEDARIDSLREAQRQSHWNAPILELAFAGVGTSADSSFKALHVARYAAWLTGGLPAGQRGQVLAGAQAGLVPDVNGALKRSQGAASVRAYAGSNEVKGFLGGNLRWANGTLPVQAAHFGMELRLVPGIWAEINAGITREGSTDAKWTSGVRLRYATPEERESKVSAL